MEQDTHVHIKSGRNVSHFTNDLLYGDNKFAANDVSQIIEVPAQNIFARFGGLDFSKPIGTALRTNCQLVFDVFSFF